MAAHRTGPPHPHTIECVYTRATVVAVDEAMIPAVTKVGVRELRNNVAAVVRRASAGERIVVTVDGEPAAQIGPLHPLEPGDLTLDDLVAAGLARAPARLDRPTPSQVEDVPIDVRPDTVVDELRGG